MPTSKIYKKCIPIKQGSFPPYPVGDQNIALSCTRLMPMQYLWDQSKIGLQTNCYEPMTNLSNISFTVGTNQTCIFKITKLHNSSKHMTTNTASNINWYHLFHIDEMQLKEPLGHGKIILSRGSVQLIHNSLCICGTD